MLPLKDQPKSGETARGFIGAPVPVLVIGVEITGGTSNRNIPRQQAPHLGGAACIFSDQIVLDACQLPPRDQGLISFPSTFKLPDTLFVYSRLDYYYQLQPA
jgi:hypothetical protein